MYVSSLRLHQFRSHTQLKVELDPQVTVIVGQNGAGKTNLLESLYVLGRGSSFRDNDTELLQYGTNWWRIDGVVDDVYHEVRFQDGKKQTIIDDKRYVRPPASSHMPIVLFEPDELTLIHTSPSTRRDFIDRLILDTNSHFAGTKRNYERALRQRNKLLKQTIIDDDSLFTWDILLAKHGAEIRRERDKIINLFNHQLSRYYSQIADRYSTIATRYISALASDNYEQKLLTGLRDRSDRDRLLGFTTIGPHRDDIGFDLDGKDMAHHASRGEIRSLLLALKLQHVELLEQLHGTSPIVLLDDVFSELDFDRQQHMLELFSAQQVVITATDTYTPLPGIHQITLIVDNK